VLSIASPQEEPGTLNPLLSICYITTCPWGHKDSTQFWGLQRGSTELQPFWESWLRRKGATGWISHRGHYEV